MKLDALVDWYSTLKPETITRIRDVYHEEARFRDPFNDVRGLDAIARIFEHMFRTTEDPVFRIAATHRDRNTAWVSWVFDFRLRGRAISIDGATRLDFGADGRVVSHRDYWDTAELFVELPLLGTILRGLKNRLSAPGAGVAEQKTNR